MAGIFDPIADALSVASSPAQDPAWKRRLTRVDFMINGKTRHLIGASFRGIPFFVEESEFSGGRRIARHEYPGRDEPFIEDMGRSAREFNVDGYVIGANYQNDRDALMTALEKHGIGELIHPFHGTRHVMVASFRVRETIADGGMARFGISFHETPAAPTIPGVAPAATDLLAASSANAVTQVTNEFASGFKTVAVQLTSATNVFRAATLRINNVISGVKMAEQLAATLKKSMTDLYNAADSLIQTPGELATRLAAAIGLISDREALILCCGFSAGFQPQGTTPERVQERANWYAINRMITRLLLVQAAVAASTEAFGSYEEAVTARDLISENLDAQAAVADDETGMAIGQVRADLVKSVPGDNSSLAHLIHYTPPATVPSLVLAYQLYGDVTMESDILARNSIERPGFIVGSTVLEVLSNA